MSGGYFDYGCFVFSRFADKLQHEIDINDDATKDEYGDTVGSCFSPHTMERIKAAHKIIETAGTLAREIEWLYSDDHGEESFCDLADKILGGFEMRCDKCDQDVIGETARKKHDDTVDGAYTQVLPDD